MLILAIKCSINVSVVPHKMLVCCHIYQLFLYHELWLTNVSSFVMCDMKSVHYLDELCFQQMPYVQT